MIILLSYPRSGNSWLRYIIEYLSGRPTSPVKETSPDDAPVYQRCPLVAEKITSYDPIAKKMHNPPESTDGYSGLILVVRNYKECIIRQRNQEKYTGLPTTKEIKKYMNLLDFFEKFPEKKIIVYYEDLISETEAVIKDVSCFLDAKNNLEEMLSDLDTHKESSLLLYDNYGKHDPKGGSRTRGEKTVSHKVIIPEEDRKKWDDVFKKHNSKLYQLYLERFSENNE